MNSLELSPVWSCHVSPQLNRWYYPGFTAHPFSQVILYIWMDGYTGDNAATITEPWLIWRSTTALTLWLQCTAPDTRVNWTKARHPWWIAIWWFLRLGLVHPITCYGWSHKPSSLVRSGFAQNWMFSIDVVKLRCRLPLGSSSAAGGRPDSCHMLNSRRN